MSNGLDINIRGITSGTHFTMIKDHCADKTGDLDWSHLLKSGSQIVTQKVWGHSYKVIFSYCPYERVLVAECVK